MIERILRRSPNHVFIIEVLSFTARIIFIITEGGWSCIIYVTDWC
jgi:hypothetical protein